MEFLFLIALVIFVGPIVIASVALAKASRALDEIDQLRRHIRTVDTGQPHPAQPEPATPPKPVVVPEPAPEQAVKPEPRPVAPPPPPPLPAAPKPTMEVTLGGKVASFVGAAAIIISVAFFVGYAIQHGLLGPVARVAVGFAASLVLLALGHVMHRKGETHVALARALTGAGSALLYFTVFAAHRLYALIGPGAALAGLVGAAVAVLLLARRYDSQAVATLGVVGAFITPWLVKTTAPVGVFPLVYALLVNVPVLLLVRRRDWPLLPNLATLFAAMHVAIWLEVRASHALWPGLALVAGIYAEVVALHLLALGRAQAQGLRELGLLRLFGAAGGLAVALLWMCDAQGDAERAGLWLALAAAAHAFVARALLRRADAAPEATCYLHVAVMFLALAIPVRFDGLAVPVLWGVLGLALSALPVAGARPSLAALALGLGLLGLGGVMLDGAQADAAHGRLFLNAHFGFGLLLSVFLAAQARLRGGQGDGRYDALALCGALVAGGLDALHRFDLDDPVLGLVTTALLLVAGAIGLRARDGSLLRTAGIVFLAALPFKLIIIDLTLAWDATHGSAAFANAFVWTRLLLLGLAAVLLFRARAGGVPLNLVSVSAAILLVAVELARLQTDWAHAALSAWLGLCAFAAVGFGLRRHLPAARYYGLALFALTVGKVFFIDLGHLRGLERAAAFLALGILLLTLSYVYQRVARRLEEGTS